MIVFAILAIVVYVLGAAQKGNMGAPQWAALGVCLALILLMALLAWTERKR